VVQALRTQWQEQRLKVESMLATVEAQNKVDCSSWVERYRARIGVAATTSAQCCCMIDCDW
jgi:hypothetical protein